MEQSILKIFVLLVLFEVKHFLADFPLQTSYMLEKAKVGVDSIKPLLAHSLVHAGITFLIALLFRPSVAIMVFLIDFIAHAIMDKIKSSPSLLGSYKPITPVKTKTGVWFYAQSSGATLVKGNIFTVFLRDEPSEHMIKSNNMYWNSLGFDQAFHHLTQFYIIYLIITGNVDMIFNLFK